MKRFIFMALVAMLGLTANTAQAAPFDLPDIPKCTELTPGAISIDDTPVVLGLRIVLDGLSQAQAAPLVTAALTSYAPLNVSLSVSYDSASFSNSNGLLLIDEVKNHYGGTRPAGTHLVYVMTAKNLTDDGVVGDALAGQADCIGGVAYPENAFAVGEGSADIGALVMAHELGHLLGGHHHYANCAEALPGGGENLCTLMINDVGLASFPLSTLNGLMVRGHAQLAGEGLGTGGSGGNGSGDPNTGGNNSGAGSGSGGAGSSGSLSRLGLLLLFGSILLRRFSRAR